MITVLSFMMLVFIYFKTLRLTNLQKSTVFLDYGTLDFNSVYLRQIRVHCLRLFRDSF